MRFELYSAQKHRTLESPAPEFRLCKFEINCITCRKFPSLLRPQMNYRIAFINNRGMVDPDNMPALGDFYL